MEWSELFPTRAEYEARGGGFPTPPGGESTRRGRYNMIINGVWYEVEGSGQAGIMPRIIRELSVAEAGPPVAPPAPTPPAPPPTPPVPTPPAPAPTPPPYVSPTPAPYVPPTPGGTYTAPAVGTAPAAPTWPQYNLYTPPEYGLSGHWYEEDPNLELFPWARAYYTQALGVAGKEWPSYPLYRPFGIAPPGFEGEQYTEFTVPESFFEGIDTPELRAYVAGQLGGYPTYEGFDEALAAEVESEISDLLAGRGVGIAEEDIQYQRAMARITETERAGHEDITKQLERAGRSGMGLATTEHRKFTETMAKEKVAVAQDFAIRTAEMKLQTKIDTIPQALAQSSFIREGRLQIQESRERAWGAETADLFEQYKSRLSVATTEYDMETAQNEMIQAGEERAWEAANIEYRRVYESSVAAGKDEYEASKDAWDAALMEYKDLYGSVRQGALQELAIVMQSRQWSEARYLAHQGIQAAQPGFWDYIGMALSGFLGGYGQALGGG